jgi:hypothetical protein
MNTGMPITNAVYGKERGGRKPQRRPQPRRAERLVERMIGEDAVAELYRGLGFERPDQRRKRGGRRG